MSEEYWDANLITRRAALPARGSPFRNLADAMGDDATPRCTGSIPAKPWNLELKPRQVSNYPILGTLAPFRLHAEGLTPNRDLSTDCSGQLSNSQFRSRGVLSTTSPIAN